MILDQQLTLSTPNATTATNYDSVDVIDTQSVGGATAGGARDLQSGEELYFFISIPTTWAGGTDAVFSLWGSANADKSSPSFIANLTNTLVRASGHLDAGRTYKVLIPAGAPGSVGTTLPRYLFVRAATTGTFTGTTNVATVAIVHDVQDGRRFYASGFTA